jgi:DNA-binding transcriptional LysR family regulator
MREPNPRINWNRLTAFYQTARFGNIKHACAKLNIDQSTLSRTIQSFEESLGFKLFSRVPQGVVMTKQGEILFKVVEKVLFDVEVALTMAKEEGEVPKGTLTVATTVALATLWLVQMMPGFLEKYTDIELYIIGDDERLNLKAREADVLISPYIKDAPDLIQTYLFSCNLQLYASPEYLEKFGCPQTIDDLNDHRLITFGTNTIRPYSDIDWLLRVGLPSGVVRKPYLSINSSKGASQLAEQGLGIVALSDEFPQIKELNLVKILPDIQGPIIDLYYIYPQILQNSKRVKVFGEYLEEHIPLEHRKTPSYTSSQNS